MSDGPHPAAVFFNEGPVEMWRHGFFTAAQLSDPALETTLWGDQADPDLDGMPNLVEYAFGSDPRKTGGNEGDIVINADPFAESPSFTFTYRKDLTREGITYQAELGDHVTSWAPVADTLIASENGVETRRVSVSLAGYPQRWVRLRISRSR